MLHGRKHAPDLNILQKSAVSLPFSHVLPLHKRPQPHTATPLWEQLSMRPGPTELRHEYISSNAGQRARCRYNCIVRLFRTSLCTSLYVRAEGPVCEVIALRDAVAADHLQGLAGKNIFKLFQSSASAIHGQDRGQGFQSQFSQWFHWLSV